MNYKLVKSSNSDIEKLKEYKLKIIYEYANNLSDEERKQIKDYVNEEVLKLLDNYNNIVIDDKTVGCVLITNKDDGVLFDEIYLEEEYRNKGIGSSIIKDVINKNNIVYLWVYKDNIKAIELYKKLEFVVKEETDTRYYMKYSINC